MAEYRRIETAPKTGKHIRINLNDGYGQHGFEPAMWGREKECWVNAKTGTPLAGKAVGWKPAGEHTKTRAIETRGLVG